MDLLQGTAQINKQGQLEIGGLTAVDLAAHYGTPLYVMDEDLIRQNCRRWKKAAGSNNTIAYAAKALCTKALCRLIDQEGLFLDIVSGGELSTALAASFPPERILFNGNNKSLVELELAVRSGVGFIVVDNIFELETLGQIANNQGRIVDIFLRICPGITTDTHEYVQTGQVDSKFGFPLNDGQGLAAVKSALAHPSLALKGVQSHIGSQIYNVDGFAAAAHTMIKFLASVKDETGIALPTLDLGGGLGISYLSSDSPASVEDMVATAIKAVRKTCQTHGFPIPTLIFEPGRSIVGPAGWTLYTVGSRKEIPNIRTYVSVDGGMGDNPRPALYGSRYSAILANNALAPAKEIVTIAGKCCESGDILIKDVSLPLLRPGDILAVPSTGAYHFSMASNYNRLCRPAVVFVKAGQANIVVQRETIDDILRNDLIPSTW